MLHKAALLILLAVAGACARTPADPVPARPTFARDIAPIVFAQCASCHRPGESAPFPLLEYGDVRKRAQQIAEVTASRYMPPWMPEPGHGDFVGERRLTDVQIATIRRWVEQGAPEGDRSLTPAKPTFPAGWQLGEPDLVVNVGTPIVVPAEGEDVFRTVVVPVPVDRLRFVRAVEFRPGNARTVHHAMVRIVRGAVPQTRVVATDGMMSGAEDAESPEGHVIGWAPGYSPSAAPEGMAWRIEPGTGLALEMHMQTTGKPEEVQPAVGLFFTDTPPTRTPIGLQLGSYTLDIPAGEANYEVEDRYELPVDVDLHAIYPHAHYLGKSFHVSATAPNGDERSLVSIPRWDFNWQNAYRYRAPVRLVRGTVLRMRIVYDNTAANPRNPADTPVRVRYGGASRDEMGNTWLQVTPANPADMTTLRAHYEQKSTTRQIEGFERLAADRPGDAGLRRALGANYLRVGRQADALKVLTEAVRLEPGDAIAHYNLGHALAAAGDNAGALRNFQAAAKAAPGFAGAHNNIGALLRARGDRRGALAALQRAAALDPGSVDTHVNLGITLQDTGDRAGAARHLRRALALDGSHPQALNALAWMLATAPDRTPTSVDEAVALAERAVEVTGERDASSLDTLGAAFAAAGRYDLALASAERAIVVARASGQHALAEEIAGRLSVYRSRSR